MECIPREYMVSGAGKVNTIEGWVLPNRVVEVVNHWGGWAMATVGLVSLMALKTACAA